MFSTKILGAAGGIAYSIKAEYAVSRDGRFLINQLVEEPGTPITLILNWKPTSK